MIMPHSRKRERGEAGGKRKVKSDQPFLLLGGVGNHLYAIRLTWILMCRLTYTFARPEN